MKLMTYNILEGGLGRIDPIAEVIRLANADVVVVQEPWDVVLFHKLADRLGMDRFVAESPRNPEGSTGILSRFKIREAVNYAPQDKRLTRSAFHAIIAVPTAEQTKAFELPIIGLHLQARETLADEEIRLTELPAILDIAKLFQGRSHVIAGDFNTSHPQQQIDLNAVRKKTRDRIAAQNDQFPREVVRTLLEYGYLDAHALHHSPDDFETSFTTSHPAMRVDYIFITPDLAPDVESCDVFKPEMAKFASDHFPVLAKIQLPPAK